MWSINNDDEPLETASAAVAREHVATVCSMWASVKAHLVLQIKLTAWICKLGVRGRAAPESAENEGTSFSAAERAFFKWSLV